MTPQEQMLYDALLNTYTFNLRFLSQYDHSLYERVSNLSHAIEIGLYTERYFLEFIDNDGDFDILDSHTGSYLYHKRPKHWNSQALEQTNFDQMNLISLIKPALYYKQPVDITDRTFDLYDLADLKTNIDIFQFTQPLNHSKINQNMADLKRQPKKIDKFLFVGTLLGRHIPKILAKIKSTNHFVCEHNLEIFRLSLFTCDYSLLAREGKSVVFSIMDDDFTFTNKLNIFFRNDEMNNTFFKYYATNYNTAHYFDIITTNILNFDPFIFDYNLMLSGIVERLRYSFAKFKILDFNQASRFAQQTTQLPVLFLGAGPSLGKNIEWVKKYQDKFIIVAMGAALKRLAQHDIKPDIITSLDPQKNVILNQFNVKNEIVAHGIKIFSANSDKSLFEKFADDSSSLFIYETLQSLIPNSKPISGISIGEVTFAILLQLQFQNIYLLGIDLAIDTQTGKTHDKTHSSANTEYALDETSIRANSLSNKQTFSLRGDTIPIKGNFETTVYTSRLFHISLLEYIKIAKEYKAASQKIYNLSANGAFMDETIPLHIKDIDTSKYLQLDKSKLHETLKSNFTDMSICIKDRLLSNAIADELYKCDILREYIVQLEKKHFLEYSLLNQAFNDFFDECKNLISHSSLLQIIANYYFVINRFLNYSFNNQELKFKIEKKLCPEIQHIWCNQIKQIIDQYKKHLSFI